MTATDPLRGMRPCKERDLARSLLDKGWRAKRLGSGHLRLLHPNGVDSVVVPHSPSDWRGWKNLRATIRRIERADR